MRRLAEEHHIDLSMLTGTGMAGRVTKDDVLQYLGERDQPVSGAVSVSNFPAYFDIPEGREDEIARKVLVKHLQSGNSYGIQLKEKHTKFPQPELGPWVEGSKRVGTDYPPPVLEGWAPPAHSSIWAGGSRRAKPGSAPPDDGHCRNLRSRPLAVPLVLSRVRSLVSFASAAPEQLVPC